MSNKNELLGTPENLTVGADPELFVIDRRLNKPVSAHDLFPGSKYDPFYIRNGAIQVDGVAAEFNINPSETAEEFMSRMESVMSVMKAMLKKERPDCFLAAQPVAEFEKSYFDSLPESTKLLGCEPDYNAYTKKVNVKPETKEPFRTGAGHIHVGWVSGADIGAPEHFNDCCEMTKQLDAALYIPSHSWDSDTKRRTLYGAKGSFRPKSYGVEYRPLSNVWVSDPDLVEFVYNSVVQAYTLLESGIKLYTLPFYKEFDRRKAEYSPKDLLDYSAFLADHEFPGLPEAYVK